jgi:hypothetical protein
MKDLWIKYEFGKCQPPTAGRYLVYRQKCDKWHQEVWNGTGWASNNNDITHYINVITP